MDRATDLRRLLESEVRRVGFTRMRVAALTLPPPGLEHLDRFLAEGRDADMTWLRRGRDARANPTVLLPNAQSVVTLGIEYAWPRPADPGGLTGKVASYAWGRDYHNAVGRRLKRLVKDLSARFPGEGFYAGVDARPLMERAWAQASGLGFLGKNGCVIAPAETSYLFLAVILTTLSLEADLPQGDHCGRCRRCLDACPTGAFSGPHEIDARRCISYHTIENRGAIPPELRTGMGRWVFGCDDCQEVCPHNGTPSELEADFAPREGHAWLDLEWILRSDDDTIQAHFQGSPIKRAQPWGLKRNACIVMGNLGDPAARPSLLHASGHPHPVVRDHAQWALDRV